MKILQFVFGALFIALGLAMLVLALREGGGDGQAWLAPLGLIGAGVLAISHARRKPRKW